MTTYAQIAAAKSEGTTAEQMAVVRAIRVCRNKHRHYGPSVRELADELGVAVADVYQKLVRLRRDGLVAWDCGIPRSIRVVGE